MDGYIEYFVSHKYGFCFPFFLLFVARLLGLLVVARTIQCFLLIFFSLLETATKKSTTQ